jgi:hypothetical protein
MPKTYTIHFKINEKEKERKRERERKVLKKTFFWSPFEIDWVKFKFISRAKCVRKRKRFFSDERKMIEDLHKTYLLKKANVLVF